MSQPFATSLASFGPFRRLSRTSHITGDMTDAFAKSATFIYRDGLADGSCLSFESADIFGWYLRHKGYIMHLEHYDGTEQFKLDATFRRREGA